LGFIGTALEGWAWRAISAQRFPRNANGRADAQQMLAADEQQKRRLGGSGASGA
jgi:hypothetical protein